MPLPVFPVWKMRPPSGACQARFRRLISTNYHKGVPMGVGIKGGIPLNFYFNDRWQRDRFLTKSKYGFLDFYKEIENNKNDSRLCYTLNYPEFLSQFKEFYIGFHNVLGNETLLQEVKVFDETYDRIVAAHDFEAFLEHISESAYADPYYCNYYGTFSVLGFMPIDYILIYNGSYKALLEEYSTLSDMETLLVKAYNHPLAKITKFGMFG
jgi:hypothetical protein